MPNKSGDGFLRPHRLLDDFGDHAGTNRFAPFADRKMAADIEGHRLVQGDGNGGVVAGHHHFHAVRQQNFASDVCRPEEELRLVTGEERRVPSSFFLAQDVNFALEPRAWPNRAWSGDYLASDCLVASQHDPALSVRPEYEEVEAGDYEPVRCLKNGLWLLQESENNQQAG